MSCASPDGVFPARATFIDCLNVDGVVFPFCLTARCDVGLCPGEQLPAPCVADPSIPVEVDACSAVRGELAYFAQNNAYLPGNCTSVPGFTASAYVVCSVAVKNCPYGIPGFTVATATPSPGTFHVCVYDTCSPANKLSCS